VGFFFDSLAWHCYNLYFRLSLSVGRKLPIRKTLPEHRGDRMMKTWRCVLIVATAISFVAVAGAADCAKSLYERLGAKPAIQAVASDLVDRILADRRVNGWFAHAAASSQNTDAYKAKLADFLYQSTGGPCQYTGGDIASAHKGRGVTSDAFKAVVEDLVATFDKFKVPQKEKTDVLNFVAGPKSSIVQK
jgi:hemoglobin